MTENLKYSNEERGCNIDQSAMCCISMASSGQANGIFFFQISESFFELTTIFYNNSGVGFMHVRRGRHLF